MADYRNHLSGLVPRRITDVVLRRMDESPVVVLEGARTIGKSTLLRQIAEKYGVGVIDLDDLATRDAVSADPAFFVGGERPVVVDEFQHVPEVLDAIKAELNRDSSPGRFVLAGSTRYQTLPMAARSLTGRVSRVSVRPLSQGEIAGGNDGFVAALLDDPESLLTTRQSRTIRAEYIDRAVAGGMPMPLHLKTLAARDRWFAEYLTMVVERDVVEIARIRQRHQLPKLLMRIAGQTGQLFKIAKAAEAIGMNKSMAEDYVKLLEAVFLIYRVPAWGTTLGSRVAATPKAYVSDSGLAAHLLGLTPEKLAAAVPSSVTQFGHLMENFVIGEVLKQADFADEPLKIGHWRVHDGHEVDLVIERQDGTVVGIEVKAGSRVRGEDARALLRLRDRLGSQFQIGVVLFAGDRMYRLDDRVLVLPIDRIWT
ncbi:MAG: ATP-binding protein [Acidobacteria bacterium]|nr:MAG: ATP-binding protein [Acidobacteriota bacterium]